MTLQHVYNLCTQLQSITSTKAKQQFLIDNRCKDFDFFLKWLLNNVKHNCRSCNHDDENPNNGWMDYKGYADCKRCALAEYFNQPWNMEDVKMSVDVIFVKINLTNLKSYNIIQSSKAKAEQ